MEHERRSRRTLFNVCNSGNRNYWRKNQSGTSRIRETGTEEVGKAFEKILHRLDSENLLMRDYNRCQISSSVCTTALSGNLHVVPISICTPDCECVSNGLPGNTNGTLVSTARKPRVRASVCTR